MSNLQRLLLIAISSLALAACVPSVKKEYVVMPGATPSMLKDQALAQCETQAEQIAMQQYQQELASYNQRLSQMQSYTSNDNLMPKNTQCIMTGFNTLNCNTYDYGAGLESGNQAFARGFAMTGTPSYSGASSRQIERCMKGMGFVLVEVQEPEVPSQLNPPNSKSLKGNGVTKIENYYGWEINRVEKNGLVQACYATQLEGGKYALKVGLFSPNNINYQRYGNIVELMLVDLSSDFGRENKFEGSLQVGGFQLLNTPMIGMGNSVGLVYPMNDMLKDAIESRNTFSLSAGKKYKIELPKAPGLVARLQRCAGISINSNLDQSSIANKVALSRVSTNSDPFSNGITTEEFRSLSPDQWSEFTKATVRWFVSGYVSKSIPDELISEVTLDGRIPLANIKSFWVDTSINAYGYTVFIDSTKSESYGVTHTSFIAKAYKKCQGSWINDVDGEKPTLGGIQIVTSGSCKIDTNKYVTSIVNSYRPVDNYSTAVSIMKLTSDKPGIEHLEK